MPAKPNLRLVKPTTQKRAVALRRDNMKEAANGGGQFRQLMATWWDAA